MLKKCVWMVLFALVISSMVPTAQAKERNWVCFEETGYCIEDRFREYWEQNGGAAVFGYPITVPYQSYSSEADATIWVQYFERNRLELHDANERPYDVLLGRLGNDVLVQDGRGWEDFPKADPAAPHYVPETGHAIAEVFWPYYTSHGLQLDADPARSYAESVALFGYPLSEPMMETNSAGDTVLTQYFERARFEHHPQNPAEYQVLLGLLGNEASGWSTAQEYAYIENILTSFNCVRAQHGLPPVEHTPQMKVEAGKLSHIIHSTTDHRESFDEAAQHWEAFAVWVMYPDKASFGPDCNIYDINPINMQDSLLSYAKVGISIGPPQLTDYFNSRGLLIVWEK